MIVLNGATEIVPERLYRQLKEGGRLVGVFAMTQPPRATIVTHSHDDFGHRALFDAVGAGSAGPGAASRLRFLAPDGLARSGRGIRRLLKSRSESEVWPGCPTSRVSTGFGRRVVPSRLRAA